MPPFFVGLRYYSNHALNSSYIYCQQIEENGRVVALEAVRWSPGGGPGGRPFVRRIHQHEMDNEIRNLLTLRYQIPPTARETQPTANVPSAWERTEESVWVLNALSNFISVVIVLRADQHGPNPSSYHLLEQKFALQAHLTGQYLFSIYRFLPPS